MFFELLDLDDGSHEHTFDPVVLLKGLVHFLSCLFVVLIQVKDHSFSDEATMLNLQIFRTILQSPTKLLSSLTELMRDKISIPQVNIHIFQKLPPFLLILATHLFLPNILCPL